ncbi:hypothetical protein WJX82_001550 [Trebouxia sp. C0006]
MASIYCAQAKADRMPALTSSEVIKQLCLLVILAMQGALNIGAIHIHNEVLQVLNQDVEMSGSARSAEDDELVNIQPENEH